MTLPADPRLRAAYLRAIEQQIAGRGLKVPREALTVEDYEREISRRGLLPYRTFRAFVEALNPTLLSYAHVPRLVNALELVALGVVRRLIVMLPPRYFKSEIVGRLFAAYYLRLFPMRSVGLTSYTAHRAWEISEVARNNYVRSNGQLGAAEAAARWRTASAGECWAVGMGGAITGRGYHLGLVDDPIHPEQAKSPAYKRRFADWWPETWLSRQEPVPRPGAATLLKYSAMLHLTAEQEARMLEVAANQGDHVGQIGLVMQRLGAEDPIDYLLRREVGEKVERAPQHWHVVALDEVYSDEPFGRWSGPRGLPPTCTLEPDHRTKLGQVLAPARFSVEQVKEIHRSAGPLVAASQRQQRPLRPTGDFWNVDWFNTYQDLPAHAYGGGKDWDTSYGERIENSANAWVESYRGLSKPDRPDDFPIYVHDCGVNHLAFPALVKQMSELNGPHWVEAKASGKSVVQALAAAGIKAFEVNVLGDKLARATAAQPTVANGRVWLSALAVEKLLWMERQGLLRVTAEGLQAGGPGLDLNDAFVQAVHRHLGIGAPKKRAARFG